MCVASLRSNSSVQSKWLTQFLKRTNNYVFALYTLLEYVLKSIYTLLGANQITRVKTWSQLDPDFAFISLLHSSPSPPVLMLIRNIAVRTETDYSMHHPNTALD